MEEAYKEVLDAIDCDVEGPERCVLLTHTIRAAMLAVLEEVEGAALATADIAVNEHFVEDAIVPLRAKIAALGAPQGAQREEA